MDGKGGKRDLAGPAIEAVKDGRIKFFPERHAQQYLSWLGEKRDWPISRQLWWGHRIPVWTRILGVNVTPESGSLMASVKGLKIADLLDDSFLLQGSDSVLARQTTRVTLPDGRHATAIHVCLAPGHPEWEDELRIQGFEHDPDVLDTWFSSALWPHSTFGWPEQTADLAKWYPTSVLMTGRDIITLWVARMVMMGIYNMGSVGVSPTENARRRDADATGIPFHHVSINPTILDGKGERMSKSKGNGVDPVDIIDTHGADALRFTLTNMATETQDVRLPVKKDAQGRNSSDRFDLGRNFCTKLWNASKFVLGNIQTISGGVASATPSVEHGVAKATPPLSGLADLWILSRFNRAVEESNTALSAYRFDQYAKACYDFFWRDFCDWYVEAAKPAMKDPARSASTANVLSTVLDGVLRLMHPMIPFITERIWWQLHGSNPKNRLINAAWPIGGAVDLSVEETFGKLQEIIVAIRNVRNEYKVDPKKPVVVSFGQAGDFQNQIDANRELIETLAICTVTQAAKATDAALTMAAGIDVYVTGVIDPEAEKNRNARQRETLLKEIAALKGRLANPSYADKAPAHLVQQTRDELAAKEAELSKLLQ